VEIGDIPDKMGNGKKGSWVLVASDTAGAILEEISGIDDENYVMINEDDIVDSIATFVARCIIEDPMSKVLASLRVVLRGYQGLVSIVSTTFLLF